MLNYDNWQILRDNLGAHRRQCRRCQLTEKGCAPYQREYRWGKINYLRWIENWVEKCHPEQAAQRVALEAELKKAHEDLQEFEEHNKLFSDRTTKAVREELESQIHLAFEALVLHYRS